DAFKKYQGDTSVTYQNLGRYNYTEMDEAFSKAAYALKVNEVSGAVKSSFGYHVILKTKEYEKNSLEDEKANILDKLVTEKTSSDTTLSAKALISIRTKYGLKINDSELEEFYNRYLNKQANTK
nr:peptidylprolyl isomerase [Bacilli bacterium]